MALSHSGLSITDLMRCAEAKFRFDSVEPQWNLSGTSVARGDRREMLMKSLGEMRTKTGWEERLLRDRLVVLTNSLIRFRIASLVERRILAYFMIT